jgi:hypothetical protein
MPNNSTGLDLIDMWVLFRFLYFIEAFNWSLIFRDPDDHSSEVEGLFDLDQEDSSSSHEQDQPWYWKILHRWSLWFCRSETISSVTRRPNGLKMNWTCSQIHHRSCGIWTTYKFIYLSKFIYPSPVSLKQPTKPFTQVLNNCKGNLAVLRR